MLKFLYTFVGLIILAFFLSPIQAKAQTEINNQYYIARVTEISKQETRNITGSDQYFQELKVVIQQGEEKGREVSIEGGIAHINESQKLKIGDKVVVVKGTTDQGEVYYIADRYRLPLVGFLAALFFGLIIFYGRLKGFTSILGLIFSIGVLTYVIVPQILSGTNPLLVSFLGAVVIAVISLYLAHGFNKRTSIALASTLITLFLATVLSVFSVALANLFGTGSEEAYFLRVAGLEHLDLRGLLLGGIVIGVLGVLDDITTAQSAAVDEIHKANTKLGFFELYKRGVSVGREHISSLVNTLVLAYAGASFPLFILFTINKDQPFWVIANSEFIVEEVIRTLVGSTALIFAVPITTALAAYFFATRKS